MKPILKTLLTWLITLFVGSLLAYLFLNPSGRSSHNDDALILFIVMIVAGIAILPGMVVFHFIGLIIDGKYMSRTSKGLYLSLIAAAITLVTILIVTVMLGGRMEWDNNELRTTYLSLFLAYIIPFIGSVLLFNSTAPQPIPVSFDDDAKTPEAPEQHGNEAPAEAANFNYYLALLIVAVSLPVCYFLAIYAKSLVMIRGAFGIISLLQTITTITGLVLLGMKKKWGWILTAVQLWQSAASLLYLFYFLFRAALHSGGSSSPSSYVFTSIINITALVFLYRPLFYVPFGINKQIRLNTLLAAIAISLLIYGINFGFMLHR